MRCQLWIFTGVDSQYARNLLMVIADEVKLDVWPFSIFAIEDGLNLFKVSLFL